MNLEFPRFVFKAGSHYGVGPNTYDMQLMADKNEYDKALRDGWFHTVTEALLKKEAVRDLDDLLGGTDDIKKEAEKPKVIRQRKEV